MIGCGQYGDSPDTSHVGRRHVPLNVPWAVRPPRVPPEGRRKGRARDHAARHEPTDQGRVEGSAGPLPFIVQGLGEPAEKLSDPATRRDREDEQADEAEHDDQLL